FILEESLVDTMADQRTMAELLRAPTDGYAEANVVPLILAEKFELKHSLINIMTSNQFFGLEKGNPHDHIRCDANSSSSSEIAKLTHAVNQQTSAVTTAILKQFQATSPLASVKAVDEICVTCGGAHPGIVIDGPSVPMPPPFVNPEEDERVEVTLINPELELENTPLNENCLAVILKKLPEKLGDPRKFIIPYGFSELNCKALADIAGIAIDVFVSVEKFTFPANFVIFYYESDPRVPLILGRPFLRTARAMIDVHREEMILCDDDERLTLNMRHDASSYSNQPQKESINMINIYDDSHEDYLEDLFATNHLSGNPTFSSHIDLTLPEVKDDIFDPKGDIVQIEKLLNLDSTKYLPSPHNINPLSGSTTSSSPNHLLEEFADELALITFPSRNDDLLFDIKSNILMTIFLIPFPRCSPMNIQLESNTVDVYNDPFDSKGEKIKESKLLIGELDLSRSSDFLPSPEYVSFLFEDFSEVDALPSTNNEDKVFNLGILIHENLSESNVQTKPDKNVDKITICNASLILEDFNPP
nr:hypothetical protein [Tanacetum cinerariifolium]